MSVKKQLLDPLGTVCKLVALNFTEINTKISIQDHILTLHKPNSYQCLIRLYNGDGKENISELYDVIIRIIRWYLIPKINKNNTNTIDYDDEEESSDTDAPNADEICQSDDVKQIISYLCNAFRKLEETYDSGNVVLALQFFINILEDALIGEFDEKRLPKHIRDKEDSYKTLLDYNKIKNMWELKDVKRIAEQYNKCFDLYYNDCDTANSTKIALINSYLKSIDSILEIADKEFQKLILNSNNG